MSKQQALVDGLRLIADNGTYWTTGQRDIAHQAADEIVRLREEVEAWRRSFPTQHVRPGATFCCTKLEEE